MIGSILKSLNPLKYSYRPNFNAHIGILKTLEFTWNYQTAFSIPIKKIVFLFIYFIRSGLFNYQLHNRYNIGMILTSYNVNFSKTSGNTIAYDRELSVKRLYKTKMLPEHYNTNNYMIQLRRNTQLTVLN